MKTLLLLGSMLIVAIAAMAPARAAVRIDTMLTMSDGVKINVAYFRPTSPRPAAGHPALVLVHGFGGSQNDYASTIAPVYADSGYFSLAYTVRGQGQDLPAYASGGEFTWFTADRELADCREIIEWVRSRADVNRDRVGIEGVSQGGLTSWGAVLAHLPIRCAVPIISAPYYSSVFCANGVENYFFVVALYLAKLQNKVRMSSALGDTLYNYLANDQYDSAVNFVRRYDPPSLNSAEVPVFMQMAWQDDIFTGREFYRAFDELQVPKKLFVWPGPHALPTGDLVNQRLNLTFRFYRKWLKDDSTETIMKWDSTLLLADPVTGIVNPFNESYTPWLTPPSSNFVRGMPFYFTPEGSLSERKSPNSGNFSRLYLQNVSNDAFVFQTEPFTWPTVIVGASVQLVVNSTGRKFQANVLLFDYDSVANTTTPITRGAYEVRLAPGDSIARRTISYDLSPQYDTIRLGHRVVAAVKYGLPGLPTAKPAEEFGQAPYPPQETATDTLFVGGEFDSRIELYGYTDPSIFSAPTNPTSPLGMLAGENPIRRGDPLRLHLPQRSGRVELIDLRGVVTVSRAVDGEDVTIETGDVPAGVYFLKFYSAAGVRFDRCIVIP